MSKYFLIGKIQSASGRNGLVKIFSYTDIPERFLELKDVYLEFYGDKKKLSLENVVFKNKFVLLKFLKFDNLRDVDVLIGRNVFALKSDLPDLDKQHLNLIELVGSTVTHNNQQIGKIIEVFSAPANDVMMLKNKEGKEILLPVIPQFIEKFDKDKMQLTLKKDIDLSYDED